MATKVETPLGFEVRLDAPYEEALERVEEALGRQGFGVLTRIDVKKTLREKLDQDFREYAILGACNPRLAHKALSAAPEVGLLLPCNVTVEAARGGGALVRIGDPEVMLETGGLARDGELRKVASEARRLLGAA
ncbi:MAG TPA: DUF302 domain-containing protein, partial [Longimicrobiales bacterium]|nr:DUF302 domain-containing protein [Longimicrobiales bacterium]